MTPWVLFTIFLFGPCEVLIPLLMFPAATGSMLDVVIIALVFGVVTIAMMNVIVIAVLKGVSFVRWAWCERFGEGLAGLVLLLSGVAVVMGL